MTVLELIECLAHFSPDAPVRIGTGEGFADIVTADEWPKGSPDGWFVELKRESYWLD